MTIDIGDLIRFSTELLREIHEQPNHCSVLARVVEIRRAADGSKTLVLEHAPAEPSRDRPHVHDGPIEPPELR